MIYPVQAAPTLVVDSWTVPSGAAGTDPVNVDLPVPVSNLAFQVEVAEAINTGKIIGTFMSYGLDDVNYPASNVASTYNYPGTPPSISLATYSGVVQYLQFVFQNTDTIDHTVSIWLSGK